MIWRILLTSGDSHWASNLLDSVGDPTAQFLCSQLFSFIVFSELGIASGLSIKPCLYLSQFVFISKFWVATCHSAVGFCLGCTTKPQSFCRLAEEEQKQKEAPMNTLKLALEIRESTDFFVQMVQINGYRVSTRTVLVNTSNYTFHTCSYAPMWNWVPRIGHWPCVHNHGFWCRWDQKCSSRITGSIHGYQSCFGPTDSVNLRVGHLILRVTMGYWDLDHAIITYNVNNKIYSIACCDMLWHIVYFTCWCNPHLHSMLLIVPCSLVCLNPPVLPVAWLHRYTLNIACLVETHLLNSSIFWLKSQTCWWSHCIILFRKFKIV